MAASGVNIPIKAIDEFSSGIAHAVNKLGAFQKAGTQVKIGMGIGAGVASFNLLANAAEMGVKAVLGMVKAANEDEASIARLQKTLDNNVVGWRDHAAAVNSAIDAGMKLGFSDDKLRESLGSLAARTKDVGEALNLQQLAMDLARAKGIDLATAANLIGKVYNGNVGILARYGVAVDKGSTSTEALAAIQKMAGGQAETYSKTTEGSMASIEVAVGEVAEEFGKALVPVLQALLPILRDKILPVLSTLASVFGEVLTAAAPLIGFVIDVAVKGFQMLANAVITAGQAMLTLIRAIPGPWQEGADAMDKSLQRIKDSINGMATTSTDIAKTVGPQVAGALAEGADDVGEGAEVMIDPLTGKVIEERKEVVVAIKTTMADLAKAVKDGGRALVSAWRDMFTERNRSADIADELIVKKSEIAAARKVANDKKLTAAERAEGRIRLRGLQADYASLLVEQTTYGTRAEQIARSKALLTSKALLNGLRDKNPDIAAQWAEVQRITEERLRSMEVGAGTAGRGVGGGFAGGIKARLYAVDEAAEAAKNTAALALGGKRVLAAARGWGANVTENFAEGLTVARALAILRASLLQIINIIRRMFAGASPPLEGPLHFVDKWGENIGKILTGGIVKGANLSGLALPVLGTGGPIGAMAGGGGVTVNVPIQNFYGTQDNIAELSRQIGMRVRLGMVRGIR